jgi:hypothetical protein
MMSYGPSRSAVFTAREQANGVAQPLPPVALGAQRLAVAHRHAVARDQRTLRHAQRSSHQHVAVGEHVQVDVALQPELREHRARAAR